jgi:hypothetical protein
MTNRTQTPTSNCGRSRHRPIETSEMLPALDRALQRDRDRCARQQGVRGARWPQRPQVRSRPSTKDLRGSPTDADRVITGHRAPVAAHIVQERLAHLRADSRLQALTVSSRLQLDAYERRSATCPGRTAAWSALNPAVLAELLNRSPDAITHAGWYANPQRSPLSPPAGSRHGKRTSANTDPAPR